MTISIFHYHLNPGGVTRIIEAQIKSIRQALPGANIRLITGACQDTEPFVKAGVIPEIFEPFNYLVTKDLDKVDLEERFGILEDFFNQNINRNDIIHFHNLNLGKNPLLTLAISNMAADGYRVFNHAHDFAEDRPANQKFMEDIIAGIFGRDLNEVMYPQVENYLFGTLNGADLERLSDYGIPEERKFLLPNPVIFAEGDIRHDRESSRQVLLTNIGLDPEKKIVTYPVRVIERKNIGEYILLACLFREKASWLVTLPPQNPVEVEKYEKWKVFCREMDIDLHFEAGLRAGFSDMLMGSDFCFTTSYREGFGMVFLEPWMMGTPVIGRNLPSVTQDLKEAGMQFSLLYDQLKIPGEEKDFKDLAEDRQREAIRLLVSSKDTYIQIKSLNPWMENLLGAVPIEIIVSNQNCIKSNFSIKEYGEKLIRIYRKLSA